MDSEAKATSPKVFKDILWNVIRLGDFWRRDSGKAVWKKTKYGEGKRPSLNRTEVVYLLIAVQESM